MLYESLSLPSSKGRDVKANHITEVQGRAGSRTESYSLGQSGQVCFVGSSSPASTFPEGWEASRKREAGTGWPRGETHRGHTRPQSLRHGVPGPSQRKLAELRTARTTPVRAELPQQGRYGWRYAQLEESSWSQLRGPLHHASATTYTYPNTSDGLPRLPSRVVFPRGYISQYMHIHVNSGKSSAQALTIYRKVKSGQWTWL